MKKILLLFSFCAMPLQSSNQEVFTNDSSALVSGTIQGVFLNFSTITKEKPMAWKKHVNYTLGAFGGALAGSFFVNIFDTLAARRFSEMQASTLKATTKCIFKSYIPLAVGVVPMRAISFGVYSVCQEILDDHLSFGLSKTVSAALSGISLAFLTTPAEIMKTRRQIDSATRGFTFRDIKGSFVPLAFRIVPTVTCMLAGTEAIQYWLPIDNICVSIPISSLIASSVSQIIGTPAENMRIYRVKEMDYKTSTLELMKKIGLKRMYAGFFYRGFALGTQASCTLVAAKLACY